MTEEEKIKGLDVKGGTRPLKAGDPVAYINEGIHYQGKIDAILKNGDTVLKIYNIKDVDKLTVPKEAKIEPLFTITKDNKEVYLKYTYNEVKEALAKADDIKTNFSNREKPIFALMQGDKTAVVSFEKKIEDKMSNVEGRLEMRRKSETGVPYITGDVKFKELNLDRPVYGMQLNESQKEQLKNTGELGLVDGFTRKSGEQFKLWVSLDKELNKVVTKSANDIYLGHIFGVQPSEKQVAELKQGKGVVMDVKGQNYFFQVSAATQKLNGIKSFKEETAKELGLIAKEENQKKNSKGVKM